MSKDNQAVNDQVVADTTAADSAAAENLESEVAEEDVDTSGYDEEGDLTPRPETETETEADKTESESDETETETQPQQGDKPLSPKAENRFQQLANDNKDLRLQLEELRVREAQFANEQELVNEVNPETGEYYTPQEIERIAWQQSRQTQAQQVAEQRQALEIRQTQQTITTEAQTAIKEFPIFDENSPEYNPALAQLADQRLARAIVVDENGQVIRANDSVYEILKTIADASKANAAQYEAKAQRATEKMLANADPGTSATEAKAKTADDDMFDAYDQAI